jgi:hypothetical protein
MEAPHHCNLVAPFLGCTCKGPGTEGELRGFEVSFWTSRDRFGPADPSNPWHLGNRVGNHSMWQAANLVETEGPAGNSVAVSATKAHSEEVQYSPEKTLSHLFSIDMFQQGLRAFIDSLGHLGATLGATVEQLPNSCPHPISEIQNAPHGTANQECQAPAGEDSGCSTRAACTLKSPTQAENGGG